MRRVSNPPNRFEPTHVEWEPGEAPLAAPRVHLEHAKSIVAENRSPDLPFRYSINPYRGCQHACAYCYARPSHAFLGFGAGTDFDTQIIVKRNAPELLEAFLSRPSWQREPLLFSGNTDCYQPVEGRFRLTRAMLELCLRFRNPVTIITKSALILQDLDLLRQLAAVVPTLVYLSIPFVQDDWARAIEPAAASPTRRFSVLEKLSAAGVPTGVSVSPLIPGLSDAAIAPVLRAAWAAGARHAFAVLLRLPREVAPIFVERLREGFPLRARAVEAALREMRGGTLNNARFGQRMVGHGPRYQALYGVFAMESRRLGFECDQFRVSKAMAGAPQSGGHRPVASRQGGGEKTPRQLSLFAGDP